MTSIANYTQTDVPVNQAEELDPIVTTPVDENPIVVTPDDTSDDDTGVVIVTLNARRRDTLQADLAEAMTQRLEKSHRNESQRRFEQRKAMQKEAVLKDLAKQEEEFRA